MTAWDKAEQDAIWRAYCATASGFMFIPAQIHSDEIGAAVALGAIHGRLGEGYPLPRPALLAEVATLCGEADADPVGEALARVDERGKVLDALTRWFNEERRRLTRKDAPDHHALLDCLDAWISEQRKAVAR